MDDFISPIPRPLLNPLPQVGEEAIVPSTFVARSGCVWLVKTGIAGMTNLIRGF